MCDIFKVSNFKLNFSICFYIVCRRRVIVFECSDFKCEWQNELVHVDLSPPSSASSSLSSSNFFVDAFLPSHFHIFFSFFLAGDELKCIVVKLINSMFGELNIQYPTYVSVHLFPSCTRWRQILHRICLASGKSAVHYATEVFCVSSRTMCPISFFLPVFLAMLNSPPYLFLFHSVLFYYTCLELNKSFIFR